MAAPPIPPIRLGLISDGRAVENPHRPASRRLAARSVITACTDSSAARRTRFAAPGGAGAVRAAPGRVALPARDDVDAVLIPVPVPHPWDVACDALTAGKDVFRERPTGVDTEQVAAIRLREAGYPDRTVGVSENSFYRGGPRSARVPLHGGATGRPHPMAWRHADRLVPREGGFSGTPWRVRSRYRGGVHHLARIRLCCGDIAPVHGAAQAATRTIDAPSDLALNPDLTGGAIGNHTASHPEEIPVPPEPDGMRPHGTESVLAGSSSRRRVTRGGSDATTNTTVFRGVDNGHRAKLVEHADAVRFGVRHVGSAAHGVANAMVVQRALDSAVRAAELALDPAPGAGPVPPRRSRGSTALFFGPPGQHINSSASFAA
jgi:predicted dehydrogenase